VRIGHLPKLALILDRPAHTLEDTQCPAILFVIANRPVAASHQLVSDLPLARVVEDAVTPAIEEIAVFLPRSWIAENENVRSLGQRGYASLTTASVALVQVNPSDPVAWLQVPASLGCSGIGGCHGSPALANDDDRESEGLQSPLDRLLSSRE